MHSYTFFIFVFCFSCASRILNESDSLSFCYLRLLVGTPGVLLAALGRFLVALGRSWALLGRSWALLGRSWAALGRSWAALGPSWAALGRSQDASTRPCTPNAHMQTHIRNFMPKSMPKMTDLGTQKPPKSTPK